MAASVWAPGSNIINVDAETSNLSQVFSASAGQTVFNLTSFSYVPGSGALAVYRNGQRLVLNEDWEETSTNSFTLLFNTIANTERIEAVAVLGATSANVILAEAAKDAAEISELAAANSAAEAAAHAASVDFTKDSVTTFTNKIILAAGSNTVEATSGPSGSPLSGFRNRIINGAMEIWQRGALINLTVTGNNFTADKFGNVGVISGTRTCAQAKDGPTIATATCYSCTQTGTPESVVANDYNMRQYIELGLCYDLARKYITVSFWYKSNRVGTHAARLIGNYFVGYAGGIDRVLPFTVTAADTWEKKVITFDSWLNLTSLGSFLFSDVGLILDIGPRCATVGQGARAVGDYFRVTEVQLEAGPFATPFERRFHELELCKRYYEIGNFTPELLPYAAGNSNGMRVVQFTVTKPVTPTVSPSGLQYYSNGSGVNNVPIVSIAAVNNSEFSVFGQGMTNYNGFSAGSWVAAVAF